jgi:hypothetical protein
VRKSREYGAHRLVSQALAVANPLCGWEHDTVARGRPPHLKPAVERAPACSSRPRCGEDAAPIAASRWGAWASSSCRASRRTRASLFPNHSPMRGRCADRRAALCARGRGRLVEPAVERAPACSRRPCCCEAAARIAALRCARVGELAMSSQPSSARQLFSEVLAVARPLRRSQRDAARPEGIFIST